MSLVHNPLHFGSVIWAAYWAVTPVQGLRPNQGITQLVRLATKLTLILLKFDINVRVRRPFLIDKNTENYEQC